jgi:hypothetical protein
LQGYDLPDLNARIWQAITVGGAFCLGLDGRDLPGGTADQVGALTLGALGDLAVFDVPTDSDPFAALIDHGAGECVATVLGGTFVHRRSGQ